MSLPKKKDIKNLIVLSTQGDEKAFHGLYERLNNTLFRYVLSRTGDRDIAIDLLQDVFIDLWRGLQKFTYSSEEQFYGFVFKIIKRKLSVYYKKHQTTLEIDENDLEQSHERDVELADDLRILTTTVGKLKEKSRVVIELRYWSGLTFREIGVILNCKETTVKVRHHRALKTLQEIMKEYM
ncbi:RNA polymerase sigma factor [Patescibacteria group bacterium]|nr:RNA polymerase sigma factor [Patescibacteria group bacterium]MBU1246427.1 RNA polymerase sigma factor [Patescibacteria group bacterium]MBU1519517.1 RNA polymerase sigma factor [Patescibacteria group bacterium]MBU1730025.1 RNA polymerase sigma factor [Patescibacteria group bacterium]MBU1956234.1 RNA polymerase sigma factor [Patescibacteria group bacterium]